MLSKHDIPGPDYVCVRIPAAVANDASALVAAWVAPFKCLITSLEVVFSIAVTGADTDSRNLNAQLTAGTEIANVDFASGTDAAKGVAKALTLSGTVAQRTLAAGASLMFQSELVGTNGLALPIGCVRIGYRGL